MVYRRVGYVTARRRVACSTCRRQSRGHGETMIAMSNGEATLKIFRLLGGQPWLFPTNSKMSRIKLPPAKNTSLGVLFGGVQKAK